MGLLNGKFAGERVTEGFGELLAKEPAESSDVVVKRCGQKNRQKEW